jgi:pimeloyl-ACP methyl ester carboxylesterase
VLVFVLAAFVAARDSWALPLRTCELSHPGISLRIKAQCGDLSVPEDPKKPDGKQISLRIGVLRATGNEKVEDPIFFLAGGPGQAATEAWVGIADVFDRANRRRDIVLVDQRGTGGSNELDCDFGDELDPDPAQIRELTERCLSSLEADPRLYTTTIAMEDLDRVRAALGYERINLAGVSYGTRAALTYLRLHPDRVRSIVLQGVVPPELALGSAHARHLDRALELQFDRCARDQACGSRFPELRAKLDALIARSERDPPKVEIPDPRTAEPLALAVDRAVLAGGIRFLAYAPETAALIPLLIHEAHENGRFDRLAAQTAIVARQIRGAIASGMELSVICSEDVPLFPDPAADADTLLGDGLVRAARAQCEVWPRGEMPPDFHAPVRSDVPALLISGELDPVTPPQDAEQVKKHLSRSQHLIAAGHGHTMPRGCTSRLLDRFFTGTIKIEARCLDRLSPPPFFVRLTGPEP